MPVISMFFGIIIRMYAEAGERHHKPHIHAEYSGHQAVISLDGEVLQGELPRNKMDLLIAWLRIHREDLEANWKLATEGEPPVKIDPLR